MDSIIKPIYEFILWDNCNNNCKFCWQKKHPVISDEENKMAAIDYTTIFLNSTEFQNGSHVLLVGGELFDSGSNNVRKYLSDFFSKVIYYQFEGIIDLLYLNTNLLYEDTSLLFSVLDMIKDRELFDRLKFTTSYDVYGRFKDKNSESLFFRNIRTLRERYPEIKIVVNTIMTKQFCEIENSNTNSCFTRKMNEDYGCYVNLLPYIDVIVDGPFIESQKNLNLPYAGSENQRVIDVQKSLEKMEVILYDK